MMVSPELISASSAPSTRPLKSCETKLGQVIMKTSRCGRHAAPAAAGADASGAGAQLAVERVGFLHQRKPGVDLHHIVEVFLVLQLLGRLALDDDDRTHQLMVLL